VGHTALPSKNWVALFVEFLDIITMPDFNRKHLPHDVPDWVEDGSTFFITVCCQTQAVNQLCHLDKGRLLLESIAIRQKRGIWSVSLLTLMPDHLHALMSFNTRLQPMRKSMKDWKRYLARTHKFHWQDDFFDHRLRDANAEREKAAYTRNNPVRAKLCESPDQWLYTWDAAAIKQAILDLG
jgi:putative transposase